MFTRFGFLLLAGLSPSLACLPVSADRIMARDLAAAIPAFSSLPENTVIGFAPMPGAVRTFARPELESIARAHRIVLGAAEQICFELPKLERLPETETVAAMRRVLPPNSILDLLELPKFPVPAGEIVFPLEGIDPPQPSDPAVQNWKGYIRYAGTRRMLVWARVRVIVERPVVIANRNLKPGETITEDAVAVVIRREPLKTEQTASDAGQAVGRTALRGVKAGEPIILAGLDQVAVIHRGDPVKVEVVNGTAHLQLNAVAETNARDGDLIQLRNPASGKIFRARAVSAGKAVVSVGNSLLGKSE